MVGVMVCGDDDKDEEIVCLCGVLWCVMVVVMVYVEMVIVELGVMKLRFE